MSNFAKSHKILKLDQNMQNYSLLSKLIIQNFVKCQENKLEFSKFSIFTKNLNETEWSK